VADVVISYSRYLHRENCPPHQAEPGRNRGIDRCSAQDVQFLRHRRIATARGSRALQTSLAIEKRPEQALDFAS
jgi:hypothetical protein